MSLIAYPLPDSGPRTLLILLSNNCCGRKIRPIMKNLTLWVLISVFSTVALASSWTHSPEVGIGYTNNANYEDANTDSDMFFWVRNYSSVLVGETNYSLWISYKDYSKISENDVFNWRGGSLTPSDFIALEQWSFDFGLGGQHYTSTSPGTTEDSFGNFYVEGALLRDFEWGSKFELSIEPGYQLKTFSDLADRLDHKLYFNSALAFNIYPTQTLTPLAEIGMIFSSDSVYNRTYLTLGADWSWQFKETLELGVGFAMTQSVFSNRTTSTETVVSGKRSSFKTGAKSESETQSLSELQGFFVKSFSSWDLKAEFSMASQSTKSGFENYSEVGATASALFKF